MKNKVDLSFVNYTTYSDGQLKRIVLTSRMLREVKELCLDILMERARARSINDICHPSPSVNGLI